MKTEDALLGSIESKMSTILQGQATITKRLDRLDAQESNLTRIESDLKKRRLGDDAIGIRGAPDRERSERLARGMGHFFLGKVAGRESELDKAADELGLTRSAMQEGTDSEGGYLVPKPLFEEIMRLAAVAGVVRGLSRVIPMKSNVLEIPNVGTMPTVGIFAEEAVISQSEPTIGSLNLVAKKIAAIAKFSMEIDEDAVVNLGDFLLQLFAEVVLQKEDFEALEGTTFTGLFSAVGVNSVNVGGAIADLDKFIDALAALPLAAVNDPSCAWVFHPKLWKAISKLKDLQDRYLIDPLPTEAAPLSLFGKRVHLSDQISVTRGAGSDTTGYVGAWRRGMIFGDRKQLNFQVNPFGETDFKSAQVSLRAIERVGIAVAIPEAFTKMTAITVS